MRRRAFAALAAVSLTSVFLLPIGAVAGIAEDKAAIREIWVEYQGAVVDGDTDKWLGLWDEAGIQMPPGVMARGKDVLVQGVPKAWAARPASAMEISPEEIEVAGDWAYSRGTYSADQMVDGAKVHIEGKFMTIHKRQPDGSWRIYRDIFNANPQ